MATQHLKHYSTIFPSVGCIAGNNNKKKGIEKSVEPKIII